MLVFCAYEHPIILTCVRAYFCAAAEQDNLDNMTSDASNMIFIFMWPIFNVLLASFTLHFNCREKETIFQLLRKRKTTIHKTVIPAASE